MWHYLLSHRKKYASITIHVQWLRAGEGEIRIVKEVQPSGGDAIIIEGDEYSRDGSVYFRVCDWVIGHKNWWQRE